MFFLHFPFEREQPIEPFGALGNLHDTEIDALLNTAESADLAVALHDAQYREFLDRVLGRSDASQRQRIESARAAADAASPAQIAAAQTRVVQAGTRVLSLAGVRLPSVHVFEDLAHLSDGEARSFLDGIGPTDLALALKAANAQVKNHIVGAMSEPEREMVTTHMEWLGPVRLTTVLQVQLAIVQAVRADDPMV